jgi:hypothetical protein
MNSPSSFIKNKQQCKDIEIFKDKLLSKYKLEELTLSENDTYIDLSNIVVSNKGIGEGTKIMKELICYANNKNKTVTLSPEKKPRNGTTSKARLIKFYKKFGFIENKGNNKVYEIFETMYLNPTQNPINKIKNN